MKKIIFTLTLFCACFICNAQSTGTGHCDSASAPDACTPEIFGSPGLYPLPANLTPIIIGDDTTFTIYFKNFDTAYVAELGQSVTVEAIIVDTISNLPDGLCWRTDVVGDSFVNQQNGCIVLTGTPTAAPGQYRLNIAITAYIEGVSSGIPYNANGLGLYYYIRVICPGDTSTHDIDTNGQAFNANLFVPYTACGVVTCVNVGGTASAIPPIICAGQTTTLWVDNSVGNIQWQQSADDVNWTNVAGGSGANSDDYITPGLSGSAYYRAALTQTGCDTVYSTATLVTVNPVPDDSITANGPTTFCAGDSVQLSGPDSLAYRWNTTDTVQAIYAASTNNYSLTVTGSHNCTAVSSILVTVKPVPAVPTVTESNDTLISSPAYAYQWFYSGDSLIGNTSMELFVNQNGDYYVDIGDTNGCQNQSAVFDVINASIAEDLADAGIKLYPNPNNGVFTLEFAGDALRNIEIDDALGNAVFAGTGISKTTQINMQNAAAGVYLLRIKQAQQITNVKFIVMK